MNRVSILNISIVLFSLFILFTSPLASSFFSRLQWFQRDFLSSLALRFSSGFTLSVHNNYPLQLIHLRSNRISKDTFYFINLARAKCSTIVKTWGNHIFFKACSALKFLQTMKKATTLKSLILFVVPAPPINESE